MNAINSALLSDKYAKAATQGRHWDTKLPGFHLACGKAAKTWYVEHRGERTRLGRYPDLSTADARDAALEIMRPSQIVEQAPTLEQALNDYLDRPKLRSDHNKRHVRAQMEVHMRKFLKRRLHSITKQEIRDLFVELSVKRMGKDKLGRPCEIGGPRTANHVMQSFRTIWNHAADKMMDGDLKKCPTSALELHSEDTETKVIDDLEGWKAQVAQIDPMHRAIYLLLITTGMRKTECLSLTWSQIEADRIHLPMTKNGRPFDVPLEDRHRDILNLCRLGTGEPMHDHWVFPSPKGDGHIKQPQKIVVNGTVATLQMHRATFATWGEKAGLAPWQVGRLLNHTLEGVTSKNYIRTEVEHYRPFMQAVLAKLPV